MNADGSGQRRLTRNAGQVHEGAIGAQPRWSPDGSQIAFVSGRDGNAEVYVMNADGSGQRNLSRHRAWARHRVRLVARAEVGASSARPASSSRSSILSFAATVGIVTAHLLDDRLSASSTTA